MKKIMITVLFCLHALVRTDDFCSLQDFFDITFRDFGIIYWVTVTNKKIVGLYNDDEQKSKKPSDVLFENWNKPSLFFKCLRSKNPNAYATSSGLFLCGRYQNDVDVMLSNFFRDFGRVHAKFAWNAKSVEVAIFPMHGDIYSGFKKEQNNPGNGEIVIASPCKIIALKIDENCNVSNEALGFVIKNLLKSSTDQEFHAPGYSVRLTVINDPLPGGRETLKQNFMPNRQKTK